MRAPNAPPNTPSGAIASSSSGISISTPSNCTEPNPLASRLSVRGAGCGAGARSGRTRSGNRCIATEVSGSAPWPMLARARSAPTIAGQQLLADLPEIEARDHHAVGAADRERCFVDRGDIAAVAVDDHQPRQAMPQQAGEDVGQHRPQRRRRERDAAGHAPKYSAPPNGSTGATRVSVPAPWRARRSARPCGRRTGSRPSARAAPAPRGCRAAAAAPGGGHRLRAPRRR